MLRRRAALINAVLRFRRRAVFCVSTRASRWQPAREVRAVKRCRLHRRSFHTPTLAAALLFFYGTFTHTLPLLHGDWRVQLTYHDAHHLSSLTRHCAHHNQSPVSASLAASDAVAAAAAVGL